MSVRPRVRVSRGSPGYRSSFGRGFLAAVANANAFTDYREPLPRHSWNPRAVSDQLLIADEFPDQFQRQLPPVATCTR